MEPFNDFEVIARGCVRVSALQGGWFTLPNRLFVSNVPEDEASQVPSLSFLVTYESGGDDSTSKYLLFDLGLRRDPKAYTRQIQKHLENRKPIQFLPDVRQSLLDGGLELDAIGKVIFSHVHWDHIGSPSDYPHAKFFVGAGSLNVIKNGFNKHMSHSNFQHDLFDGLSIEEFPDPSIPAPTDPKAKTWRTIGGLNTLDISGNGCLYIVDTPGHLIGHISLLARLRPCQWVLLIGDACHDVRLLTGEKAIAEWCDPEGRTCCIHMDKEMASKTLARFRELKEAFSHLGFGLQIVFAHDVSWARSNPAAFFPGCIE